MADLAAGPPWAFPRTLGFAAPKVNRRAFTCRAKQRRSQRSVQAGACAIRLMKRNANSQPGSLSGKTGAVWGAPRR